MQEHVYTTCLNIVIFTINIDDDKIYFGLWHVTINIVLCRNQVNKKNILMRRARIYTKALLGASRPKKLGMTISQRYHLTPRGSVATPNPRTIALVQ